MSTRDLLIEIGTEELPPKALPTLSAAFRRGIEEGLGKAGLGFQSMQAFASPRRLAVLVRALPVGQGDKTVERRGPALAAAFDEEGVPTKAAQGFAASCGVTVDQLERVETDKGAWLVHRSVQPGRKTAEVIPEVVRAALDRLPIPKRMRWGDLEAEFVRPVHWVVVLFGDEVIDCEILSVRSGRETRGHRFHHPAPLYLGEPEAYEALLLSEGRVIADFGKRREAVRAQVLEAAAQLGGTAVIDDALLDEVTALVEWPVAIVGNFEERFLEVPAEALVSSMKGHQKYFHVVDGNGQLMPHFIAIANIDSREPEHVCAGNERVIRPRLSDASFFWHQDRKQPLSARIESLRTVVFQQKLGTLYEKSERVAALAGLIARQIGAEPAKAERAARLAKCDLMTAMVGEFPELQGIMGRYYALHDGEPADVAAALDEQYMPRQAGDALPSTGTGQALAIADRLDTLAGIFGIGQLPTGDKDPFGLRRAALGVLRTCIEKGLDLDLRVLLQQAVERLRADGVKVAEATAEQVFEFMMERLRAYYQESGIATDTFEAVLARQPTRPLDFHARIHAVAAFRRLPEAESLAAANKRIHNILRKAEVAVPDEVQAALFVESAERALGEQLAALEGEVRTLLSARRYEDALCRLAGLREAVDGFFDAVMVMADDAKLRDNRLALLKRLGDLFLEVADISRLQG
ncbi:MAG: glycine--tRNA ligase subunit beta [Thiohalomonadaceae bacterium]